MRTTTAFLTGRRRLVLALLALALSGLNSLEAHEAAAGVGAAAAGQEANGESR